jgi:hypothetical protein
VITIIGVVLGLIVLDIHSNSELDKQTIYDIKIIK